ncbi:hypothetical protein EX30DRAFT_305963 [Ascodesmis nigricans]|uniref:AB hydrolase-1 domain-containing protein n=1 Tax=Ascodesmis nigricans TaxID=341454 RepID=A0A4S2MZ46_9PEZI|nr:hypothetical protein EX30DRAFT_305963 [Ascodesmis nigricans]
MAKFWPGKSSNRSANNSTTYDAGESSSATRTLDADERTSLLHGPPPPRHHHLSPDDPAVSPYNLFSVRSLRWISVILLLVSFLWWLVLLISTFITIPAFYTRGSGWFGFSYATLATGTMLAVLMFYGTPSKTERGLWFGTLFFLFVNLIIIVSAEPIREGENWSGIVSCAWALIITGWAILCDTVVEHGRHSENERLTGHRHSRRTFREWVSVFSGTILLVICLLVTILFTINLSILARDGTLPAPGHRIPVDNNRYQVHLHCIGSNTTTDGSHVTTILAEAGEHPAEGRLASWLSSAQSDQHIQRFCYWDRPGYGWSDNAASPMSAGMAVDALSEALEKAGEHGPWVLVSHGIGGIYSRIFASRHVKDVKGLLLVDAFPESLLPRIGKSKRGLWLWLRGVLYPLGIDRAISTIFMRRSREDRVFGRNSWQRGGEIKAKLQEQMVATTFTMNEIVAARAILPREMPIAVVSSGKSVKADKGWADGQRSLAKLSDRVLGWDVVNNAGHDVWRDEKGKEVLERRLGQLLNQNQQSRYGSSPFFDFI